MILNINKPHFVKIFLGWLVLPLVVENGVLLGHLSMGVLLLVHVEDAERNDERRKDDNHRQCDGEDVEETAAKVSTFLESIRSKKSPRISECSLYGLYGPLVCMASTNLLRAHRTLKTWYK